MYAVIIRHTDSRDETISFPRSTTPAEIIEAATLYSKPCNLVDVFHNDEHVATALAGGLATFLGTELDDYANTKQVSFA